MTTTEFLQRLPALREMFPREIVMECSLAEYLQAAEQQQQSTLPGLDAWREQSAKMENGRS